MSNRVEINLESENLLADSTYNIVIRNLIPNEQYELHQELLNYYCINAPMGLDPKINWQSSVTIQSDAFGQISLKKNPAISGSYHGVTQMGLFFSSQPKKIKKITLPQKLEDVPIQKKFQLRYSISLKGNLIAEKNFERYFQLPNITSKDFSLGQAYGRVFYDEMLMEQPAIIVLSGSDGRIEKAQNIAQLFASHGFVALAVCYFGLEGLSKNLEKIPIEIIEKSANYLKSLPQVDTNRIGIYGRSKGAELALVAATYFEGFKCIVVNSPTNLVLEGIHGWRNSRSSSWTYKGKELPYMKFRIQDMLRTKLTKRKMLFDNLHAEIAIEEYSGALLCIGSIHDEVWNSEHSIEQISLKMKDRKVAVGVFEKRLYENCGHMLTIANQPNNRYKKRFNSNKTLVDSNDSWEHTVNFFHRNL